MKGTVKFFNDSKGFGFITAEDGKDYFVHTSGVLAGLALRDGDKVTFDVTQGDRGLKAVSVALDRADKPAPAAPAAADESEDDEFEEDTEDEEESEDEESDDEESEDEEESK